MDWIFIARHLISGCVPLTAALAAYQTVRQKTGRRRTAAHIAASSVFALYLIGILTLTGVCVRGTFSPEIVYIPFADMIRGPADSLLNVLLFVPLGVFLPLLYEEYNSIGKVAAAGLFISLSVEAAQMFGFGITDVNDLITNTVGAGLGFVVFRQLEKALPQARLEQLRAGGSPRYTEPLLLWAASCLIMLTVQTHVYDAFFSGTMAAGEMQSWE
ncbi:MAG: VanZ family protein [Firmicutes bacterium]|nr:VanZ family protein [Bacillota bacterium]